MSAPAIRLFGGQTMTQTLRRVLVRPPRAAGFRAWREFGWRARPDAAKLAEEHEAFCEALRVGGAEVVLAETKLEDDPDSIYVFDPAIVADRGAIVLRSGKEGRLVESAAIATDLERAGVPIAARLVEPQLVDGGDTIWLDEDTLILGPYRGLPTEHERIPLGRGVCGSVAATARTEVVPDVRRRPGHIACDIDTRSEVVAPILRDGRILGVLDVDSNTPDAFGAREIQLVEEAASPVLGVEALGNLQVTDGDRDVIEALSAKARHAWRA